MDSSPDNAGTGQYCQMVRVRQVRRKGVREESAAERSPRAPTSSKPGGSGLGSSAHLRHGDVGWGTPGLVKDLREIPRGSSSYEPFPGLHVPAPTTAVYSARVFNVAGREATVKDCGVVVARLQGHSWAPTPSNGHGVNVGTIPAVPFPASGQLVGGKARRRLMLPGWGGGPVVVRGRESRPHGEGVQCVRGAAASSGGRR